MEETTKAYIAGLIDGEGSIRITNTYIPRLHRKHCTIGLKIGMQSKLAIDYCAVSFNVKPSRHGGYGGTYEVSLWQKKARDMLEELLPYLITKKPQAQFAIWAYDVCFGSRPVGAVKLTEQEICLRDLCTLIMATLNKRDSMSFHGKSDEFSESLKPLINNLVGMVTLSQASMGLGIEEGATTRSVSPNNNQTHERPTLIH